MILTLGRINCEEFVSAGYATQTVDSLVVNGYVGQPVSTVWIDEALLGHPGTIELIRRKLNPVRIRATDDPFQLPYYPKTNGFRVSGLKFPWHNIASHSVSWRNPQ